MSANTAALASGGSRIEAFVWLANRLSAAVLALCVLVHLATMIVAIQGGLSAAEILARTRGSIGWSLFYGAFVLAVSIHAPLGLRTVLAEWVGIAGKAADALMLLFALALLGGGMMAVAGVTR